MDNYTKDLSKGNVVKRLITFSLPFLLSNLIQSLYSVADMIIVGRVCGTAAMSGVNIGGQITFVVTNMVVGLCVGGTVLIGQYLGAGAKKEMKETVGTLFTALLFAAGGITVLMVALRSPLLRLINTPPAAFAQARDYLTVTMLGTLFIFGYNACAAVMRGMGDSRRPLWFVAIACAVNVGLDLLLVGVFDMQAMGAAIATVASQGISLALCIIYLRRKDFVFDFRPASFRIHAPRLKMLLRIGIPTSVQNMITGLSFIFMTALVNRIGGVTASAAVGAVAKFNGFAILPAAAMFSAVSAVVSHNMGAGEYKRAAGTMATGMGLAFVLSGAVFALVRLWPAGVLRLFADDADMVTRGLEYIDTFSWEYLIVPFQFCLNGLFIGAGHTGFTLFNSIVASVLARVPVAYIFGVYLDMGLRGVGLAGPASTVLGLTIGLIYFISGRWKKSVVLKGLADEKAVGQP